MSAIVKAQPTPQGQKDGLLAFSDTVQRAFANTALKLERLGQPRIAEGKRVQDNAVGFFTAAAGTVGTQRAQLAALDAKDPNFEQKATHLSGPDLSAAGGQIRDLINNKELSPAFQVAPACQRLNTAAEGHR